MLSTLQVTSLLLVVLVLSRLVRYRQKIKTVQHLPGFRPPFKPLGLPGVLFKTSWWNMGAEAHWVLRRTFHKSGENVSVVPFLIGAPAIYTSNLDVARQVIIGGHKTDFIKPVSASRALLLWGMNLVASDTDVWRKHRRIVGPAFNNKLYESVWSFTAKTYYDMMRAEGWDGAKEVNVTAVQSLTLKVRFPACLVDHRPLWFRVPFRLVRMTLDLRNLCHLNHTLHRTTPLQASEDDGDMSVNEAFRLVAEESLFLTFAPKWLKDLRLKRFAPAMTAFEVLTKFMRKQVTKRREDISNGVVEIETEQVNVFNLIMQANHDEDGKYALDDLEVIGNVWVLLFAGHETTAHSLAATLGFLSIHEEIQQEVYDQIKQVLLDGRTEPTVEDYTRLDKVLAVFYEALRMFPAGHLLIREATKDTVLQIPNPLGQDGFTSLPVPKGGQIVVDMVGVQYNPRYFDEPELYKPARWYGVPNESEAFTAFSVGPRACVGRKFATTEAVSFLTLLLRDWEIKPILNEGETKEEWRNRVLDARVVVTLGINDVPLKFVRRE
ncbi:cytochrome P450 [Mucidula mucida]|nr:cytochrome P450 [Mucidula mucida]